MRCDKVTDEIRQSLLLCHWVGQWMYGIFRLSDSPLLRPPLSNISSHPFVVFASTDPSSHRNHLSPTDLSLLKLNFSATSADIFALGALSEN